MGSPKQALGPSTLVRIPRCALALPKKEMRTWRKAALVPVGFPRASLKPAGRLESIFDRSLGFRVKGLLGRTLFQTVVGRRRSWVVGPLM